MSRRLCGTLLSLKASIRCRCAQVISLLTMQVDDVQLVLCFLSLAGAELIGRLRPTLFELSTIRGVS
ncbi:hypothetical protein M3J09_004915 [Ascochyta lentis]